VHLVGFYYKNLIDVFVTKVIVIPVSVITV